VPMERAGWRRPCANASNALLVGRQDRYPDASGQYQGWSKQALGAGDGLFGRVPA
jgi:hypothetical protein